MAIGTHFFDNLENQCLFCAPAAHNQGDLVLLISDHFYLFAGLGAIKDGLIIIAPHKCDDPSQPARSLSDLPGEWMDELAYLRLLVAEFYRNYFNEETLTFEHGRAGSCIVPNGNTKHCYHAHLCCFPFPPILPKDLDSDLREKLLAAGAVDRSPLWEDHKGRPAEPIRDFHDIRGAVGDSAYILFESISVDPEQKLGAAGRELWHHRIIRIGDNEQLQSQYARRLLANRIGQPDLWDWRSYPRVESAKGTKDKFWTFLKENEALFNIQWPQNEPPRIGFVGSVVAANTHGNDAISKKFATLWGNRLQHQALGEFIKYVNRIETPKGVNPTILDAGCGPANYSQVFYHQGYECVGIDISDQMLAIAQKVVDSLGPLPAFINPPKPPQLSNMSVLAPDFPDETFDAIWFSAILVHVPRIEMPDLLTRLRALLKPDGILYISAQLDGGTNQRVTLRREGRVFFYYDENELRRGFRKAGFDIVRDWMDTAGVGSGGDTNTKVWRQFILRRSSAAAAEIEVTDKDAVIRLGQLGEAAIHNRILSRLPHDGLEGVNLFAGDDCAALAISDSESLVFSTDPCPLPVLSMLEGRNDPYRFGWYSMLIGLSDLAAMGAAPRGMLLALEAEESMNVADLDEFYSGAIAASQAFSCPILGGNVKDAKAFSCVGTAIGSVKTARMLTRNSARPGQHLLVLGEMGRFWAGVLQRIEGLDLGDMQMTELLDRALKQPVPRVREGRVLSENGLSRCAMDSSDGLTACFGEIAKQSGVDINIDIQLFAPLPEVAEVAQLTGIDPVKLMLAWGDWQLVCTAESKDLDVINREIGALGCPVYNIGWVSEGAGDVWVHGNSGRLGLLEDFASTRFSNASYFSHGLEAYIEKLRNKPLFVKKED